MKANVVYSEMLPLLSHAVHTCRAWTQGRESRSRWSFKTCMVWGWQKGGWYQKLHFPSVGSVWNSKQGQIWMNLLVPSAEAHVYFATRKVSLKHIHCWFYDDTYKQKPFFSVSVHRMRCFWGWNTRHVLLLHCTAALLAPYGRWEQCKRVEGLRAAPQQNHLPSNKCHSSLEMLKIFAFTRSYINSCVYITNTWKPLFTALFT